MTANDLEARISEWLFDPMVGRLVASLIAILLVVILVRVVQRGVGRYVGDSELRYRLRKLITFGGYLAAILAVSVVFSDRLGGLTVAFGVAGAGIAFALQETIASVAGWLAVSFGAYYRVGDRVQLGGTKGDVIDIGMLRTTLMECGAWINGDLYTGRIVRVANSFVFKEPVFNYSADFHFLWDEVVVLVRYGSDLATARTIFEEVLDEVSGEYARRAEVEWEKMVRKFMIEKAQVAPMVTMVTKEAGVEFTLRYAVDFKKRRSTRDQVCSRILERFAETNGGVELATSTSIELVDLPRVKVQVDGAR